MTHILTNKHKFKLKGACPIKYHLGYDFFRDDDGTLYFSLKKSIEKIIEGHITVFGTKPNHDVKSPFIPSGESYLLVMAVETC